MREEIYIHFGNDRYEPWVVGHIVNDEYWPKPHGGLWASREGDPNGWEAWCRHEHYAIEKLERFFRFVLHDSCRILILEEENQLIKLPKLKAWQPKDLAWMENMKPDQFPTPEQLEELFRQNWCYLDYEKLSEEYDAIELTNAGAFHGSLGLWDCNSILILNPAIVCPVEGSQEKLGGGEIVAGQSG